MCVILLSLMLGMGTAWGSEVKLKTSDGQQIAAVEGGKGTTGVLLVHDASRTKADWGLLRPRLEERGYRVLALDLRGHGDSIELLDATEPDWPSMVHDLRAGVSRLRSRGAREIVIIGAGLGANLGMQLASEDPKIKSLVLLSPILQNKGFRISTILDDLGDRPVLLAAGQQDSRAYNTIKFLDTKLEGPKRAVYLPGRDTGTRLLLEHPELEDQIFTWLRGTYELSDAQTPDGRVRLSEPKAGETQGKRFGE